VPENEIARKPNFAGGFVRTGPSQIRNRAHQARLPRDSPPARGTARTAIRLVAFIAIGVMGLLLVRVRRQRKARLAVAPPPGH